MNVDITIQGLQEAQRDNLKQIAALQPSSALGHGVKAAGTDLLRYAVAVTHVDTGALRAAHREEFSAWSGDALATIYIDPSAVNPRSGGRPSVYGAVEEARGGSHAFYERTFEERGENALQIGADIVMRGLDG